MENLIFSLNPTVPIFLMMTTFFSAFTLTGGLFLVKTPALS